jgi:hypothetical protein
MNDRPWKLANAAMTGFGFLKDRAAPAVPELIAILDGQAGTGVKARALFSLYNIGPAAAAAIPHIERLTNSTPDLSGSAVVVLESLYSQAKPHGK